MSRKRKAEQKADPATLAFQEGYAMAANHPVCHALLQRIRVIRGGQSLCSRDGWALVTQSGLIHVHPTRRGEPAEWAYVIAHCALHLGFGHLEESRPDERAWQAACDVAVERFLRALKLGKSPFPDIVLPGGSEESLYRSFQSGGVPSEIAERGVGGSGADMLFDQAARDWWSSQKIDFVRILAAGMTNAVLDAVETAAGRPPAANRPAATPAERARQWFVSNYPLLGAMAAGFKVVEDPRMCQRLDVAVAAVAPSVREIYMNPAAGMSEAECRFVMAHELLHVGLRHVERCEGRDPYLWNVACDFVINAWLVEMGVGTMPQFGGLYDPELKGLSAEAVYDLVVRNIRLYRKLATLRGYGLSDMLGEPEGIGPPSSDLDDFCRRALAQGLALHQRIGRGLVPEGLVEEIEALSTPPIPWDVRLAQWFDDHFGPVEPRRTYSRASRRQSSTPDIPRPRSYLAPEDIRGRTFGVVLDTSGSMDTKLLARGLGAIASYALSRDVPYVRVVFCDAIAYDEGYLAPEAIAGRVKVRGRGGTILQPGIDLIERAPDFPDDGPILVITDGWCDRFRVARDHAILMPKGARLPFVPHAPIFEIEEED